MALLSTLNERIKAVTVGGKHGLVIARGQSRGLLLPGVAVDHNWDAKRFLEQVCVKAGLHPFVRGLRIGVTGSASRCTCIRPTTFRSFR